MIAEKKTLSQSDFGQIIWGVIGVYLAAVILFHSAPPEILEFVYHVGVLLILAFFLRKLGIKRIDLEKYTLINLKIDFINAVKYFALIALGIVALLSVAAGFLLLASNLNPVVANFYKGVTNTASIMSPTQIFPQAFSSPTRTFFYLTTVCAIAPIAEEIFYRRFLFVFLRKKYCKVTAIVVSGIIFGIGHFEGFIVATLMGIILAYVYEKEDKLTIPVLIHIFKNVTAVLAGLLYAYVA